MKYFVKNGDFVLIDNIAKLFPNCNEIIVKPDSPNKIQLSDSYMESLLISLTKINKIRKNQLPSQCWKEIIIQNIKRDNKQGIYSYAPSFKKINWYFKAVKNISFSTTNLRIKPIESLQTLAAPSKKSKQINKKKKSTVKKKKY
eukprot:365698_1